MYQLTIVPAHSGNAAILTFKTKEKASKTLNDILEAMDLISSAGDHTLKIDDDYGNSVAIMTSVILLAALTDIVAELDSSVEKETLKAKANVRLRQNMALDPSMKLAIGVQ